MIDSPFAVKANLAALLKHVTVTTDSNVFPPETNKVSKVGILHPKKMWFVCDGDGNMYVRTIGNPIEQIRQLNNLKDEGLLTPEEFEDVKKRLLGQLG